LGKLTSRLAHVAKWRLSSRLGENFEHCLSIPFSTSSTTFTGTMQFFALTHRLSFTSLNPRANGGLVFV
jgi:hypothetical protein